MKTIRMLVTAASICVAGLLATMASATPVSYDISFTGSSSVASGQIDVDSGVAVGGYLDVTSGASQGHYLLYTWTGGGTSSIRVNGGTDLIVNNIINPNGTPFLDIYGLAFVSTTMSGGYPSEGIDFSLGYGTTYSLSGYGINGWGVPNDYGSASISATPSVPDGAPTGALALAGIGLLVFLKHRTIVMV